MNLTQLEGEIVGSGAKDIDTEADNVITLKCSSCGAEVVIDTAETTQARVNIEPRHTPSVGEIKRKRTMMLMFMMLNVNLI